MTDTGTGTRLRVGIDLGGTKIAGVCLDASDRTRAEMRRPTPRDDYAATLEAIREVVARLEADSGTDTAFVGVGIPGSISPVSGNVQNANSTWLNGRPLLHDLAAALGDRPLRLANDANCFVLSEAHDGAAQGAGSVFGVILGTGCGGALVAEGRLINGHRNIGGEWGHVSLPWPTRDEVPGPSCWCGRQGCLETWISGPGLAADHRRATGMELTGEQVADAARRGADDARESLDRHAGRLARGLAMIVNICDPDVIVLGGGLSDLPHLYDALPALMAPFIFGEDRRVDIRRPRWGAASGVRGAARLWPPSPDT